MHLLPISYSLSKQLYEQNGHHVKAEDFYSFLTAERITDLQRLTQLTSLII